LNKFLRRGAACAGALALTAAIPAAAHAATLTNAGGTLTYTGTAASASAEFSQADVAVNTVTVNSAAANDAIASSGCTVVDPDTFTCPGVDVIVADGGAGDDNLGSFGSDLVIPVRLSGGSGNDSLTGGDGADTLAGGAGDDFMNGGLGGDTITGGTGTDRVNAFGAGGALAVSLDGVANDGLAGEGDNVGADVEDVFASSGAGAVTITGNAAGNILSGEGGDDSITGGAGNDELSGDFGNDTLNARDGYADRVSCGSGTDTAIADTLDQVGEDCENISTADVGNANEDKPPTVAWTAPPSGAKFAGSKVTTLAVTATDDKAVAKVVFMDDDRVVCTDTVAPYTCAYQARGADLGRNTLIAVASDALGQTASSVRPVLVTRFSVRSVSLKVSRKGSVATASGKITLPTTVSKTQGCKGTTVRVTAKSGSRTVSTRSAKVSRSCTFSVRFTSARKGLRLKATFSGNDVVSARSSRTVSAR
jgi:hypothetical protein